MLGTWRYPAEGSRFFREQAGWERTHGTYTAEGRSLDNPKRGSLEGLGRKYGQASAGPDGKTSQEGRHTPVGVSEGDAKDTKVEEGIERCPKQLDWESHEDPELRLQGRGGMRERPTTRAWSW